MLLLVFKNLCGVVFVLVDTLYFGLYKNSNKIINRAKYPSCVSAFAEAILEVGAAASLS